VAIECQQIIETGMVCRGSQYKRGFARQRAKRGQQEEQTVELEVQNALRLGKITVSGRTDKHVSAVSQVISVPAADEISCSEILERGRNSDAAKDGRLVFYDCVRAPRSFNARGEAVAAALLESLSD
jgi:tRNA pseudouridine(38-40) synthase